MVSCAPRRVAGDGGVCSVPEGVVALGVLGLGEVVIEGGEVEVDHVDASAAGGGAGAARVGSAAPADSSAVADGQLSECRQRGAERVAEVCDLSGTRADRVEVAVCGEEEPTAVGRPDHRFPSLIGHG